MYHVKNDISNSLCCRQTIALFSFSVLGEEERERERGEGGCAADEKPTKSSRLMCKCHDIEEGGQGPEADQEGELTTKKKKKYSVKF